MRRRASGLWAHLVLWPALLVSTTLVLPASHSAALRGASGPTKAPRTPDGRDEGWSWTENLWAQLVGTPNGPSVLRLEDYQNCVAEVQDQLHQLRLKSRPFTLDQAQNAASLYGAGRMEYQREHASLNIRKLCGVISFDEDMSSGTALVNVGAKTDFKSLTRFLLKRGFIPPVVPEVDTVTVGGAISGLVMESSSFRYGFLHNAVKSMDVLLPNGTVVPCSRQRNMELFRAIPHSYGTLGYVLSATLTAVAAQQELQVTVLEFPSIEQAVEKISDMSRSRSVDFVDGIIYSQDRALAIFASMQPPEALEALDTVVMPDDGRFIDVLGQKLRESEEAGRRKIAFKMSTFDYLYRWDCDIFWSTRRVDALGQPEVRRILGRGFLRSKILWAVGSRVRDAKEWVSQAMWQLLGDRGAAFGFRPPTERIIQDLGVRFDQVPSFAKGLEAHGELPFWMCPVRVVPGEQPLFPLPDVPHIMDVACFGAVPCGDEELYHNKGIDRLLEEFDGQKAFYSDVTFSREYLYKKYNGAEYDQLKAKLDPDGVLPHLYDKVLAVPAPSTRG